MICSNYKCFFSSVPAQPPDIVTAYNTSSTSLVVKWSHVPRQYFRGEPIGYKIYYICYINYDDFPFVSVNYSTNNVTLTNLHVYTKYFVAVTAVSSTGEGYGRRVNVFTGENRLLFLFGCLPFIIPVSPVELLPFHIFSF